MTPASSASRRRRSCRRTCPPARRRSRRRAGCRGSSPAASSPRRFRERVCHVWRWVSTKPGITIPPAASMTSASATSRSGATATRMQPSSTRTRRDRSRPKRRIERVGRSPSPDQQAVSGVHRRASGGCGASIVGRSLGPESLRMAQEDYRKLEFEEREIVLRADFTSLDDERCVEVSVRFLVGPGSSARGRVGLPARPPGQRLPRPGRVDQRLDGAGPARLGLVEGGPGAARPRTWPLQNHPPPQLVTRSSSACSRAYSA